MESKAKGMLDKGIYITEIRTPKGLFAGPEIKANSWSEAERQCPPYATVAGELRFVFTIELN